MSSNHGVSFDIRDLEGRWSFSRTSDVGISMDGVALFETGAESTSYFETGTMHLADGQQLDFSRSYYFQQSGAMLSVYFDRELTSLFHCFSLQLVGQAFVANGVHFCGDDTYDSEYRFQGSQEFEVTHRASGPRKAYELCTRYSRLKVME